jgi:hypothetical protein
VAGDLYDGAAQFAELSKNLLLVGNTELRRELFQAVTEATRPIQRDIRAALPDHMPNRYAPVLDADLSLTVSKTGDAGVRISAKSRGKARKLRRLEAGTISHPLFGLRHHWFNQTAGMSAGFFTDPIEKDAPVVREAILAAMDRIGLIATGRG